MLYDKILLPLLAAYTILPLTLAQSGNFTIYAYGTGVLGLPLFYSEGDAQLGNVNAIPGYNVSDVYFSIESGRLLAFPNATSTEAAKHDANYTWTSLQLNVPVNTSGNTVTFTEDTGSSGGADGEWTLYGPYVFLYDSSKQLVSHFFAEPTNDAGVFNLLWNLSEEQQAQNPDAVPVSLRTIAPVDASSTN
ncbi:hypothetical protein TMatcc_009323 [Talaromyces marneffei ATCC 18224]|uniref:Uncharacterized protein n=1 Tax=Talaromyces marneffei (strain ATCC 18224 / CBS 334.59 / QM 7333) TaxID=441960 RepID=B6QML8_TALMQ|nr:uncharacterized protein EYB26_008585 [Talaromyces marneffei]EEA21274.1 conserved hypothetical protein [Talaromyces marneffei ATCC 18224]KAE8551215.1 hypothetical protein EYB25_007451 [Talaromyces marneffei]QGA20875.1 hypothetical protein EYB26_008585 [Talaromyces marneffei]